MDNKRRGFTLIELLVVISIIAVLMSILLPALTKVRESAKRVICGSGIRGTGTSLYAYSESYDNYLPSQRVGVGFTIPYGWDSVFAFEGSITDPTPIQLGVLYAEDYIEDPEIFYCPSQPKSSDYPLPYDYDWYTDDGRIEWGEELVEARISGHPGVRVSYNYWVVGNIADISQGKAGEDIRVKANKLPSGEPILFDNIQEWEMMPHKKGNGDPQGIMTYFADGHTNFCKSDRLFVYGTNSEDDLWPRRDGDMNGPGNLPTYFDRILDELRVIQ